MNDFVLKNYVFTVREYMVLAALAGIRKTTLLMENSPVMPEDAELEYILFELYQKGFLSWKGDFCELSFEIRALFRNIKEADRELQIYSRRGKEILLCFLAEQAAVMEVGGNQKDAVRVHSLPLSEFMTELTGRGILPPERAGLSERELSFKGAGFSEEIFEAGFQDSAEAAPAEEARHWIREYLSGWEKLEKDGQIRSGVLQDFLEEKEKISAALVLQGRSGEADAVLALVLDTGLYDWLVFLKEGQLLADEYTADDFWTFLNRKRQTQEGEEVKSDDSDRYLYALPGQIL